MATQLAEQPEHSAEYQETASRDYESEAREHRWVPKEEFKGDPAQWVDAETYVRRGEEVMPFLKKRVEVQDRKIADLEKTLKRATSLLSTAEKRSYDRAVAELKAKQDEAVEIGDIAANRRIGDEIDALKAEIKDNAGDSAQYTIEEARDAFIDWRDESTWYDKGGLASASELYADARALADRLIEKHMPKADSMRPEEFFAFIDGLVNDKYPLLKGKGQRPKPQSDVSAPTQGRMGGNSKGYSDLPADARQICDSLIRKNVLPGKDAAEKRAFYAANYDWN